MHKSQTNTAPTHLEESELVRCACGPDDERPDVPHVDIVACHSDSCMIASVSAGVAQSRHDTNTGLYFVGYRQSPAARSESEIPASLPRL